jgi:hypothetical protein
VEAYDPAHPQVQEAAGILIEVLIAKGDLFDAERYAQVTYGNLRDKKNGIDQESEAVAKGAHNLANVFYRQEGDLIKAEELARESVRISTLKHNEDTLGNYRDLLARIMVSQGNFGDETRELYATSLAFCIKSEGLDGINTAAANINMGCFHRLAAEKQPTIDSKRVQLLLAKSFYEEGLRIKSKTHNPSHSIIVTVSSQLARIIRELL